MLNIKEGSGWHELAGLLLLWLPLLVTANPQLSVASINATKDGLVYELTAKDGLDEAITGAELTLKSGGESVTCFSDMNGRCNVKLIQAVVKSDYQFELNGKAHESRFIGAFEQQSPAGINDRHWNGLKTAIQEAKLTASDAEIFEQFGISVSLSGDRALIGAMYDDSAYVFDFDGVNWSESAKLTASDAAEGDLFGFSVSLSGDRALVGAYCNSDTGSCSGSAYVFDFDGTAWSESVKLTASDASTDSYFGGSVSLSGDRALVGAIQHGGSESNSGSAYVFDFDGINWSESAKLTASDAAEGDLFGFSVSLSGDRALVGAYCNSDTGGCSGSAYVFDFDGTAWSESAKLTASDAAAGDYFGWSVSLSGDQALVGASEDDGAANNSGSAYVFDFNGLTWSESVKLTASDEAAGDWFGISVSLSDDRALVGAAGNNDAGEASGSAYVFDFDGTAWTESTKLTASDEAEGDWFGFAVSLSDDRALVGAHFNDAAGPASGAAYVFHSSDLIFHNGFETQNYIERMDH